MPLDLFPDRTVDPLNPENSNFEERHDLPTSPGVPVQVMDEAAYQAQLDLNQQMAEQDAQARARARRLLKQCQEGFVPNLIQGYRMLPYDGIFASKAILKLLTLSLAEDQHCPPGATERQAFSRAQSYNAARHCGKQLYFIGGTALMALVIRNWIPAFDQPNLSEIWTGIGDWSGQDKLDLPRE